MLFVVAIAVVEERPKDGVEESKVKSDEKEEGIE